MNLGVALWLFASAHAAVVNIGAIITDSNATAYGQLEAQSAQLAVDAINADASLLNGHTLTLQVIDDGGSAWMSMRAACDLVRSGMHALIGPSFSGSTQAVLRLLTPLKVPVISYSATSPTIGADEGHDYFARVVPSDKSQGPAMISFVQHHNWTQICILFQDNSYATKGALETQAAANRAGITVLNLQSYDSATRNASRALSALSISGCRVIVNWCGGSSSTDCRESMRQARDASLVRGGDYVWILSDACENAVGDEAAYFAGMNSSLIGTICVVPSPGYPETPRPARQALLDAWTPAGTSPPIYALFLYDAVVAAAHALNATPAAVASPLTLGAGGKCVPDASAAVAAWAHGDAVREALRSVSFDGVTSPVSEPLAFSTTHLERLSTTYSLYNLQGWPGVGASVGAFQRVGSVSITGAGSDSISAAVEMTAAVQWSASDGPNAPVPSDSLPRAVRVYTALAAPWATLETEAKDSRCTATCREVTMSCHNDCYKGLSIEALRNTATEAGFEYTLTHGQPTSYTGALVDQLASGQHDVAVGDWTATSTRAAMAFEMCYPYFDTGLLLARLKEASQNSATFESMMRAIGSPFTIDVWLLLIPYILCCTLFIWFFEGGLNSDIPYLKRLTGDDDGEGDAPSNPSKHTGERWFLKKRRLQRKHATFSPRIAAEQMKSRRLRLRTRRLGRFRIFWQPFFWSISLLMGFDRANPETMPGQMLSAGFAFCNFMLLSAYTANLAATFTHRLAAPTLSGIEDVKSGKIPYHTIALGAIGGSIQDFWDAEFPGSSCYNCEVDRNNNNETHWLQIERLKAGTIDYIITDAHTLMSSVASDADCSVETVGEIFYSQGYSFITPRGSLLASRISTATLALRERMIIDTITDNYFKPGGENYESACAADAAAAPPSLDSTQIGGVFILFLFFAGLSFLLYGWLLVYGGGDSAATHASHDVSIVLSRSFKRDSKTASAAEPAAPAASRRTVLPSVAL